MQMSSFKRRVVTTPIPGTRISPYNSLNLLSTGLTSLDDLLGGGIPLSSSLLLESDIQTLYAELLLKFWIAQGLACRQDVLIIGSALDGLPDALTTHLMGIDGDEGAISDDEDGRKDKGDKMKIAFRYESMKQHATTVRSTSAKSPAESTYCSMFDLTTTRSMKPSDQERLHFIDVGEITPFGTTSTLYDRLYSQVKHFIESTGFLISSDQSLPKKALKIAISSFGSPSWGKSKAAELYLFLHRLKSLLRLSHAAAVITFPAHLFRPHGASLITRLEHVADGVIELKSFADSPPSLAAFPRHNGLFRIPKLPALNSLVPPSAKLSVLRALGGGSREGMDNDLGFRVKRRRFVIETVNPDDPVSFAPPPKEKAAALGTHTRNTASLNELPLNTDVRLVENEGTALNERRLGHRSLPVSSIMHSKPELYEF